MANHSASIIVARLLACACIASIQPLNADISSNSRSDPLPMFTSLDPETFLYTFEKQTMKGITPIRKGPEQFSLSISPFAQGANKARILKKDPTVTITATTEPCELPDPCKEICIEIGDLDGRWAMIGLLQGPTPAGQTLPPTLLDARMQFYPDVPLGTPIDDPAAISTTETCGFFTVPVCYRKRGIRFEAEALITCDVGIKVQTGVADICQTVSEFRDLTTTTDCQQQVDNNPNMTAANIQRLLMNLCKLKEIADQINLNIANFQDLSVEDLRAILYWRHAYLINHDRKTWAEFLIMPYVELGGALAIGKEKNPNKAFGVPFGSNGHHSVGFTAGVTIDFTETVEIGAEGGITHFFGKDFCAYRVPNYRCQSGIYPFATDVHIQPGNNAQFGAKLSAYHFLDRLSFYLQYYLIQHLKDKISLKRADSAFLPDVLEKRSCWKNQLFNVGMTYDISPNIALGVLWQAPFKQEGTYRSTTLMLTLNVTF